MTGENVMTKGKGAMNLKKESRKIPLVLLAVIIVFQLIWTTYVFVYKKEGSHTDEIWSYGLANSYYKPFMYIKPGVWIEDLSDDTLDNMHEWVTGKEFLDYITVQKGEQFSYGSVYSNQTLDHHPPLYYFLLHTVCSLFPDRFSWGFGYFLSCIFLIGTQIFLYLLGRKVTHSDMAALIPCFFYGGTIGALSTFIFIRQYSLLTMLSVMFTYFCACFYEKLEFKKNLIPILISAFCCFMTHYYGIIYVGAFTACICLYLLIRRSFKKMLAFGGSMAGTLGLYLAVYPAALKQMLGSQMMSDARPFGYFVQLRIYIGHITRALFNFSIPPFSKGSYSDVIAVLVIAAAVIGPLCFLFRKEKWFHQFLGWLKNKFAALLHWLKNANYIPVFSVAASVALLMAVNKITNLFKMAEYALRYVFSTFPLLCFAAGILFMKLISVIPKMKRFTLPVTAAAAAVLVAAQNIMQPCLFLFPNYSFEKDADYMELLRDKNCVCIVNDKNVHRMGSFSLCLSYADNVFFTDYDAFVESDCQKIKEKNVPIDYVITLDVPELSDEQAARINSMMGEVDIKEAEHGEKEQIIDVDEKTAAEKEKKENTECRKRTEIINSLNDGRGFDIVAALNLVNGYFYLWKLH